MLPESKNLRCYLQSDSSYGWDSLCGISYDGNCVADRGEGDVRGIVGPT